MVILRNEDRVGHNVYGIHIPHRCPATVLGELSVVEGEYVVTRLSGPDMLLADTDRCSVFKPLAGTTTTKSNAQRK